MSEFVSLKPKMESGSIDGLPIPCIVTPKLDGEFQVLLYRSGEAAMVNRWGRTRDVPALRDLEGSLGKRGIVDAMMLAELHAMENGRPMRLPDLLHRRVADPESLKLAIFDLVKVDGKDPPGDYVWKMEEIGAWMNGSKRIYPIPYKVCATRIEILTLYNQYIATGYEGIVARAQGKMFKVKPIRSVDCVLTGINKRDRLKHNQITSLKLAVMDERGRYIDLGDVASGIDLQLRNYLTKLLDFKVGEDQDTIYIRPFIVLEVEYQETFEAEKPVREFVDGRFVTVGKVDYFSLRSPRLKRFRPDKKATPNDVPSSQLLEEENGKRKAVHRLQYLDNYNNNITAY
jgi:ATP-dependent DNA ligase